MTDSAHPLGSQERPLRVAVIGSGPSGFYAADALFKAKDLHVEVDLFDRLPAPFGLVRYGVAPDHQKIKAVTKVYERTASDERLRFFGNVGLGRDITVEDLRTHYDQIVYAVGCESDRRLGIPGEDLEGSYTATEFVAWYNGHPEYRDRKFDLTPKRAIVVGVGNVAMDVSRVLVRSRDELASTDITETALGALRESGVEEVVLLGRRGPAQAAFSPKEIREIGELEGVDLIVEARDMELDPSSEAMVEKEADARKNVTYLRETLEKGPEGHRLRVVLRFLTSPAEIHGEGGRVTSVKIERNELKADDSGRIRSVGTGEFETLEAGLVFRSVGYNGVPLEGVPFHDRWGIIPNEEGRVQDMDGNVVSGEYVVGWIKRGPSGLIGTNKSDAAATVAKMIEDLDGRTEAGSEAKTREAVVAMLAAKGVRTVSFDEWKQIDRAELEKGKSLGKVREKIVDPADMIACLDSVKAT